MLPFEGTRTIETKDFIIKFEETEKMRDEVFEKLLDYYVRNEAFSGESVEQSDHCQIEACELLSDIVDIIGFKTEWKT